MNILIDIVRKIIQYILTYCQGRFGTNQARINKNPVKIKDEIGDVVKKRVFEDLITINKYSRPAKRLKKVKGIVIHWTGVPKACAKDVRNYFDIRRGGKHGYGSAHYSIDLTGDIIRMIPENEIAYHAGAKRYMPEIQKKLSRYPNNCTLSIECCVLDKTGKMSIDTKNSLTKFCVHLCKKYGLSSKDLYRHFDITGKKCHRYFVTYPQRWSKFKQNIQKNLNKELA